MTGYEVKFNGKLIIYVIHWACNVRCYYCGIPVNVKTNHSQLKRFENGKYIGDMNFGEGNTYVLSGGEPLITPKISEFVSSIVRNKCRFSIYTNLSMDVSWLEKYSNNIDYIMASIIPQYDICLDSFIEKIEKLRENGIYVLTRLVATKERIGLVKKYSEIFSKKDIPFVAYPEYKYGGEPGVIAHYTDSEKKIIMENSNYIGKLNLQHHGIVGKCSECPAGIKSMQVNPAENISQCANCETVTGTLRKAIFFGTPNTCNECCTCDIHYFYGLNGMKVPLDDKSIEGYNNWIERNKLEGKWFR